MIQEKVRDMKKIRKPQIKKNEWIPVEQGLPKEFENVLVQYNDGRMERDWLFAGEFNIFPEKIIAWHKMPVPRAKKLKGKQVNGRWININKQKAPYGQEIFVQYESGAIRVDQYFWFKKGFSLESKHGKVLYWMPLPKPYKKEVSA